jgi:hypothetical protein
MMLIVCTDRGRHPVSLLGQLDLVDGLLRAAERLSMPRQHDGPCLWLDHPDPQRPDTRVQIRCPRCRRHIEWRHETATKVITRLHEAGMDRIDVSHLP